MPETLGTAQYELGVDLKPLRKGLTAAEGDIRRSGQTAEKAWGQQGKGAADKLAQSQGLLVKQSAQLRQGILAGVGLAGGVVAFGALRSAVSTVTDTLGRSIDAASDLEESQSKVNQVFTESSDVIHDWASGAARDFGLSSQAALEAAATFGNFTQALGSSEEEASDMSRTLVELAADLASFNNTSIDEVLVALRSGLAGEAEPMRRLGVSISAARVESYLLANGIAASKAEITDAMKVTARYAIIMQDTTKAQGDFKRTSDGLANSQRIAEARMQDALAELGQTLLPIVTMFTQFTADVIPDLVSGIASIGDVFDQLHRALDQDYDQMRATLDVSAEVAEQWGIEKDVLDQLIIAQAKATEERRRAAEQSELLSKTEGGLTYLQQQQVDSMVARYQQWIVEGRTRKQRIADIAYELRLTEEQVETVIAEDRAVTSFIPKLLLLSQGVDISTGAIEENNEEREAAIRIASAYMRAVDMTTRALAGERAELARLPKATVSVAQAFADMAPTVRSAVWETIGTLDDLGPGIRDTIKGQKATVREAMTDLRWAMEHPFAGEKYIRFLEKKQKAAQRLLEQAIKDGNEPAAARARELVEAIQGELSRLDAMSFSIEVDVQAGQRRVKGSSVEIRAGGGPVTAGRLYRVNELGTEMYFRPSHDGYILDAARTRRVLDMAQVPATASTPAAPSSTVNVSVNVSAGAFLGRPADALLLGQQLAPVLRDAIARIS